MPYRTPSKNLLRRLQLGQVGASAWPRNLMSLPPRFCARIDSENIRESLARAGMGSLLLELERMMAEQTLNPQSQDFRELMTTISNRVCDSQQQRSVFLMCHGDVVLQKLLQQLVFPRDASAKLPHSIVNECVQILAELAISDVHQAEVLASQRPLLALLFNLMGDKATVDAALTLAQELLAVGLDIFPLSSVDAMPELIGSLSPRGLSLFGRALAVLLAKSAEQTMDGIPAPECVAPDLCASCANNQMLLCMPSLLERIVALLTLRAPPPGLWSHMLAQLPSTQGIVHQWAEESEHGWEQLLEAPAPQMVVLLSPEQVPPGLRELVTTNPALIFPGNTAPGLNLNTGHMQGSLHLAALQTALWSTLQADLLYVLWALMGGKTKQEAQRRLVSLGLLEVLQAMFERLDWTPPALPHHGQHGSGCSCSPQSCLQMQLLRTLQALCEKESNQTSYHRLLLLPMSGRAPSSADVSMDDASCPNGAAAARARSHAAAAAHAASHAHAHTDVDAAADAAGMGDVEAAARRGGAEASKPDSARGSAAGPSLPPHACMHGEGTVGDGASDLCGPSVGPSCLEAAEDSFLHRILKLLLEQPPHSVYLLGLASCVHKWVQASSVSEQQLVARFPGFIDFVLQQLLCEETPPEPQLQVFFDLLAEMLKFNLPLLSLVQAQLASGSSGEQRVRLFIDRLNSHIVDASIFIQCVVLTLNADASPRRGCKALRDLGLLPAASASADASRGSSGGSSGDSSVETSGDSSGNSSGGGGGGDSGNCCCAGGRCETGDGGDCCQDAGISTSASAADCTPPPPPLSLSEQQDRDACAARMATTLASAASGPFAAHILAHKPTLVLRLMGAVNEKEVSVETMCVINAAIIFFLIAEGRGERAALLQQVCAEAGDADAGHAALSNFLKLLAFWSDVYHSHSCEKRFLEFSSGIPFDRWLCVVGLLKEDLQAAARADMASA
uniref:Uncharacterized protein n=1 Tax=Chrysotila carterae TaxID=13221 RepID=A0A7S4BXM2_CHRCT